MKNIPQVRLKHCFREANCCADALAKFGTNMEDDFVVFESPHPLIASLLQSDKLGETQARICNLVVAITQFVLYIIQFTKKKQKKIHFHTGTPYINES